MSEQQLLFEMTVHELPRNWGITSL